MVRGHTILLGEFGVVGPRSVLLDVELAKEYRVPSHHDRRVPPAALIRVPGHAREATALVVGLGRWSAAAGRRRRRLGLWRRPGFLRGRLFGRGGRRRH